MKLVNAFSLNMLPEVSSVVRFTEIAPKEAYTLIKDSCESFIGHADLAEILCDMFGYSVSIPVNRNSVVLECYEKFVIAQYKGARLPEGSTVLPEGASIVFILGEIFPQDMMIAPWYAVDPMSA